MVTTEMIKAEIDRVPEGCLEAVYEVVTFYSRPAIRGNGGSLLSKLREITFDGPEDFSCYFCSAVV
jgi:hypothetical protein